MSLDHTIIWNQLNCQDLDGAIQFYGDLFGWTVRPEERETYVHFYQGDRTVAGLMLKPGGPEVPNHWAVHVGTSAIDGYCERAQAAGGSLLTTIMDIPSTGKLCAVADPGGAVLIAFQPTHGDRDSWGPRPDPGNFCWFELLSQDLPKAIAFYKQVVGWDIHTLNMGDFDYTCFSAPGAEVGQSIGGAMPAPAPEIPDHWLPYVAVEDAQASHDRAVALGGTSCHPPTDLPGGARFAVLQDPQQAVFAIYQGNG